MTGPNPIDRGKSGSKIHVLSDRAGIPWSVAVSAAANANDSYALKPLVVATPAIKSRRGPRLLRGVQDEHEAGIGDEHDREVIRRSWCSQCRLGPRGAVRGAHGAAGRWGMCLRQGGLLIISMVSA
jgi:hypothetical protein